MAACYNPLLRHSAIMFFYDSLIYVLSVYRKCSNAINCFQFVQLLQDLVSLKKAYQKST